MKTTYDIDTKALIEDAKQELKKEVKEAINDAKLEFPKFVKEVRTMSEISQAKFPEINQRSFLEEAALVAIGAAVTAFSYKAWQYFSDDTATVTSINFFED